MIVCLHGFLGRPADWDFLRDRGFEIEAPDVIAAALDDSRAGETPAAFPIELPPGDVLLGYSMGGRLALQALIGASGRRVPAGRNAASQAATFTAAVIISAGLNLEDPAERAARVARDETWALRFERDDWQTLMRDWNAQPVFGGHAVERQEEEFDRRALAAALRQWSAGRLPPLASELHRIDIPVLWIAGELDRQYVETGRRATSLLPNAELWICPGAGHRVPWEQPDALVEKLREWSAGIHARL